MADTILITVDLRFPQKVGAYGKTGMITGTGNITSYSLAKVAPTSLMQYFRSSGPVRVVVDGVSSNGYAMRWDQSVSAFRAYNVAAGSAGGALTEVVSATSTGIFNFVAIGMVATGGG